MCHIRGMRRNDICLYLGPADRAELQALITNRNTARKLVWRAEIVLATADGHGTFEIMRRALTLKPTVWRWHPPRHRQFQSPRRLPRCKGRDRHNARTPDSPQRGPFRRPP
jgi:hypothetical protein